MTSKEIKKQLKDSIKGLAIEQRKLKIQRKENLPSSTQRVTNPRDAAYYVLRNREKLRVLYITYGLLGGKKYEEIERNPKTPFSQSDLQKLLEPYLTKEVA